MSSQAGLSSNGSLANTTPSGQRSSDRVSPHVVASSREPLAARMFNRAFGSASATATIVLPKASRPRSKINAASSALSTTDSARDDGGNTARSTIPLCESSHSPSVNGADADASTGMPALAERTAATTHSLRNTGATDANDASLHSG